MSKFAVNKNNCVSLIFSERGPEARRMQNDGGVPERAEGGGEVDISLQKRAASGLSCI